MAAPGLRPKAVAVPAACGRTVLWGDSFPGACVKAFGSCLYRNSHLLFYPYLRLSGAPNLSAAGRKNKHTTASLAGTLTSKRLTTCLNPGHRKAQVKAQLD